jgi:hypothetical protein
MLSLFIYNLLPNKKKFCNFAVFWATGSCPRHVLISLYHIPLEKTNDKWGWKS